MSRLYRGICSALTALVVLALCGIGAAAASAEVSALLLKTGCSPVGTIVNLCWENTETENFLTLLELEGEEEFTILSPLKLTLLSSLGEEAIEINCGLIDPLHLNSLHETELGGLLLQHSPLVANYSISETILLFLECLLIGALGEQCKIPTEKGTFQLDAEPRSETDLVFLPESGTIFFGFVFEQRSGCPATVIGERQVTGTQLCEWEEPTILDDLTAHLLECGKSSLRFGSSEEALALETALEIEPVHLNERWDITEIG